MPGIHPPKVCCLLLLHTHPRALTPGIRPPKVCCLLLLHTHPRALTPGIHPPKIIFHNKDNPFNPPLSEASETPVSDSDPDLIANQPKVQPQAVNLINWDTWTPIATSKKQNPVGPVKDPVRILKPYVHQPPPTCRSNRLSAPKISLPKGTEKISRLKNSRGLSARSKRNEVVETFPLSTSSALLQSKETDEVMNDQQTDPTLDFLEKQFPSSQLMLEMEDLFNVNPSAPLDHRLALLLVESWENSRPLELNH
ncbi:hypothetical protein PCANC_22855 [Puccinia coronata f. sp. avenae]|uniref:Uncharacterized protein n=1 Tax=Puccinia coronata f. sp. avenae TaxID=200324 RepID=A0A2N5U6Z8_9BASI|nr:hypothetical protein PCANC_22855 [Puccinia coronata f. sp. avenae]